MFASVFSTSIVDFICSSVFKIITHLALCVREVSLRDNCNDNSDSSINHNFAGQTFTSVVLVNGNIFLNILKNNLKTLFTNCLKYYLPESNYC